MIYSNIVRILLHLLVLLGSSTFGWVFDSSNREVIDVAFWNNRAFVCMTDKLPQPQSAGASKTRKINYLAAEIFEAPWPEDAARDWALKALRIEDQELEGECSQLRATVSIDVDARGRLFALLLGSKNCHPRIAVIDLVLNRQIAFTELTNAPRFTLRTLVVDFLNFDTRAYIGGVGDNYLLVYSLREESWWPVKFESREDVPPVPTAHLALSKKDDLLYMTSSTSHNLFSIDTGELGGETTDGTVDCSLNRTLTPNFIGEKLGRSTGLWVDPRGGLIYSLIRDYAVVRWDSRFPLVAENHEVLLQSAETLPDVRQIFKDSQKTVWALNAFSTEENLHCTKILKLN